MNMLIAAALVALSPASDPVPSLGQFAGHWEVKASSINATRASSNQIAEDCQWSDQRAVMICEENVLGRPVDNVTLMWWDSAGKTIRFEGLGLDGLSYSGTITIAGDVWTWAYADLGERRFRTINRWSSADRIEYTSEKSIDSGKTWTIDESGTEIRTKKP